MSSSLETSPFTGNISPFTSPKLFFSYSIFSALLASATTLRPFLASSSAMAAPMPALAPVTKATFPIQRSILTDNIYHSFEVLRRCWANEFKKLISRQANRWQHSTCDSKSRQVAASRKTDQDINEPGGLQPSGFCSVTVWHFGILHPEITDIMEGKGQKYVLLN